MEIWLSDRLAAIWKSLRLVYGLPWMCHCMYIKSWFTYDGPIRLCSLNRCSKPTGSRLWSFDIQYPVNVTIELPTFMVKVCIFNLNPL
jgi:hypothetical protein